jgi:glycosyltransferase involved in cell wall biosynthesis
LEKSVSVIIPVHNASAFIDETLRSLTNQTYSTESTEIIVIDNGSTDTTPEIVKKYPVTLLYENSKPGPYPARNKGFAHARGEIIALIDANKIPDKNWLQAGTECLEKEKADLAGGNILFDLNENPSASQLYDAITFNNNRSLVLNEGGSAAGNLFFRRELLKALGPFPEKFRSGMDIWWSQRAVRNGYKLVFAEHAVVWCKPRNFRDVLRKSYRVGKAHPFNMKQNGVSPVSVLSRIFRTFAPPKVWPLKQRLGQLKQTRVSFIHIWLVAWLGKILMGMGRINGLLYMKKKV